MARLDLRGRRRPAGGIGIRHHFLVIPSVLCAAQAARVVAEGTAGAVAIEHQHGCSQLGGDARLTAQVLTGLGTHPNVAGTLVVSLGCETVQGLLLHRAIEGRGQRARFVGIQQAGGTLRAIEAGREALAHLREAAAADPDVPVSWRDLRVGVEAAWLGLPVPQAEVFARVVARLLSEGATVIQAVPDAGVAARGSSSVPPALAAALARVSAAPAVRTIPYAASGGLDGAAAAGPRAVAAPGRGGAPTLLVMPAPATRIAQKTGLAAAGAHVILSPLVEGLPAGCPVAPVVHIGIAPYARPLAQDAEVLLDEAPSPGAAEEVLEALAAARREETIAEALGTFEMAIHRIAPTM